MDINKIINAICALLEVAPLPQSSSRKSKATGRFVTFTMKGTIFSFRLKAVFGGNEARSLVEHLHVLACKAEDGSTTIAYAIGKSAEVTDYPPASWVKAGYILPHIRNVTMATAFLDMQRTLLRRSRSYDHSRITLTAVSLGTQHAKLKHCLDRLGSPLGGLPVNQPPFQKLELPLAA